MTGLPISDRAPSGATGIRTLSAVIPTKDRPRDIAGAVASILAQSRLPGELIIIDQSLAEDSRVLVERLMLDSPIRLVYVHDCNVRGLVEAKQVGARHAEGEIVCFLEDDVVLERGYLEAVEAGFVARPEMMGCSGIITNLPYQSALFSRVHALFFRGMFRDPRPGIFNAVGASPADMIQCDVLSGGLSAWRREVFAAVPFDTVNGFHLLEDIEFSTRVVRRFGRRLYVNRGARLAHYYAAAGRDAQGARQRRKLTEALMFFKKCRLLPGAWQGITLVLWWWLGEAVLQSVRIRSSGPVIGYFNGLRDGILKKLRPVDG